MIQKEEILMWSQIRTVLLVCCAVGNAQKRNFIIYKNELKVEASFSNSDTELFILEGNVFLHLFILFFVAFTESKHKNQPSHSYDPPFLNFK